MFYLIALAAALYGSLVLYMAVFQRQLMYHPARADADPALYGLPHQDIFIDSDDGTRLQLWYHEARPGMATVIYFHGNAGHLGNRADLLGALIDTGLGVAAISYRGYGKSHGSPHEQGIYADARAAIRWVLSRGIPMTDIAFFGESLGTGVAIKMAGEFAPRALFLEAPYTSVAGRAAEIYWYMPVRLLIRDRFDSLAHIRQVRAPLTIFHGRLDPVIPLHHAERLYEAASEPKRFLVFDDVGHTEFDNRLLAGHVAEALHSPDPARSGE